jgi:Synergist-CTERM protein sorting domain-containing protein
MSIVNVTDSSGNIISTKLVLNNPISAAENEWVVLLNGSDIDGYIIVGFDPDPVPANSGYNLRVANGNLEVMFTDEVVNVMVRAIFEKDGTTPPELFEFSIDFSGKVKSGGSSSGCSAYGYFAFALLAIVPFVLRRK